MGSSVQWERTKSKGNLVKSSPTPRSALTLILFLPLFYQLDPRSTSIAITEPVMNLPNVQEHYDQMIFEEYDFQHYLRCPGAQASQTRFTTLTEY